MFKLELFYVFSLYFSYMFYDHFYNFVLVFKPLRSFGLTVCSGHKRFWRVGLARGEAFGDALVPGPSDPRVSLL